jgi:UDP-N-acetylglucosamine--N-acetylmuramyl-(pentapeptide) pyrophosphoryl-undecaprenol N-acetylglucosamine transferase
MNVLIAGGGTAGHVSPALALAGELASRGHDVRFAGASTGQESRLVPAAGFPFVGVEATPFERKVSLRALKAPIVAVRSVKTARPLVESADVVVGMGGYASVPVALAALRSRRPLVLHEQNAVPGLANRAFARAARLVAMSFAESRRAFPRRTRTLVTGNPVRPQILAVPAERDRLKKEGFEELDLDPARRTLVVLGGSQGALHVNRSVLAALPTIEKSDLQVLMQTGPAHAEAIRSSLPRNDGPRVHVVGFLERIELAYALADLVIARAGATTIAEIAVCGLPSVLIPYPYATGRHQEANARALQRAGASTMVLDDELGSGGVLGERIASLLDDDERRRSMGERATGWSRPEAAEALADAVIEAGEPA